MFQRLIFLLVLAAVALVHRPVMAEEDSPLNEFEIAPPESYKVELKKHPGAFSFDVGGVVRESTGESRLDWISGLQYRHDSMGPGHWETGLDILGDRLGAAYFGYRFIFDRDRAIRPQLKFALASVPPKGTGLQGVVKSENARLRVGVALASRLSDITSFRFEGEFEADRDFSTEVHFRFGLVWPLSGAAWKRPARHRSP